MSGSAGIPEDREQNGMKFGAGQTGRKALRWDFKLIFARSCMRGFMQIVMNGPKQKI